MKYGFLLILLIFGGSVVNAFGQQPQLATYREVAQVLVDQQVQNMTTSFVTLSSSSPLEMHVPTDLDEKIRNSTVISTVIVTNAGTCVPGVQDQACIMVNLIEPSLIETYNTTEIQTKSRQVGDALIGDINKAFAMDAQFNSVYVNPIGQLSSALGTSGSVAGNRTISVVYTASRPDSSYLFDTLSTILLPKQIRDAGGFYDVAKDMAQDSNSTVTFAIAPLSNDKSLYQLQVSRHTGIKGEVTDIKPLDLFGISNLQRSSYFSGGFFPLNSIFEVSVLSKKNISITGHGGDLVPTKIANGQKMPADFTKAGWIFDPESGQRVTGIYLFGTTTSASAQDLALTIGTASASQQPQNTEQTSPPKANPDYSTYAIIGIVVAGGGAIYLFMRRR